MERLYDRVSARLQEMGISWSELEDLVEKKTGIVVGNGFIKKRIKNGRRISQVKFRAMAEIVGEEIVWQKDF